MRFGGGIRCIHTAECASLLQSNIIKAKSKSSIWHYDTQWCQPMQSPNSTPGYETAKSVPPIPAAAALVLETEILRILDGLLRSYSWKSH